MVRPDSIKLCLFGPERAGKTTLVNSLLQLGLPLPNDEDRTPGVDIRNQEIEAVGKVSTWDFASQPTFHSAHGLFFQKSNTVFFLVLPLRGEISSEMSCRLFEDGMFWCAFIKASLRTLPPHLKSLIRLAVVFNLIGLNEEPGVAVRFQLKEVAKRIRDELKETFEVLHVFEMDCSKSRSDRMKGCRHKLKKFRDELLKVIDIVIFSLICKNFYTQEADDIPKLCHAIEKNLSLGDEKRKRPLAYFLAADDFEKWVSEEIGIVLKEDEKKVAVEYLESSGIVSTTCCQ